MKTVDLFSGAGGFSSGFHQAGFDIVGALELNKRYAATHDLNFKNSNTIVSDIRDCSAKQFSKETLVDGSSVDVIIGGPPCQTFSTIGGAKIRSVSKATLKEDPRNYLYKNYLDYVEYFSPDIFIMENVPNMKTKYKGKLFENLLAEIDRIGYSPKFEILNAVNYGAPQQRKRLFIVGVRKGGNEFQFPSPTHFAPGETEKGDLQPFTTVHDAISDLPEIYDGIREHLLPYSKPSGNNPFKTLMRDGGSQVGNNVCRMSNERAKKIFSYMKQGDKYMDLPPEVRKILPFREDIFPDRLKRLVLKNPSWTILAHIGMDGYMYIHPTEDRTLSVREAARIQSFSDKFEFVGNMREQYIQVGNSVPPLLSKALAGAVRQFYDQ